MRGSHFKLTMLKGLAVLLPSVLLVSLVIWIIRFLVRFGWPYAIWLEDALEIHPLVGLAAIMLAFCLTCFGIGYFVTTAIGAKIRHVVETEVFDRAPGYELLRNIVSQFLGGEKSPLSAFALVEFESSGIRLSGFVTDRSANGWCTIFVPTAPNPTSGLILHVKESAVSEMNISGGDAIETILGCGAGSREFHERLDRKS